KIDGFWNHLINACHRTPRIRAMFTRRLRTLMDELLQSPGIPRTALRYEKNLDRLKKHLDPDVALDRQRWGVPSWGNRSYDFATSLRRLETGYLQPRRQHLFVTHSSNPGGIIPGRQTTGVKLVFGAIETVPLSGNAAESFVEIVNNNTEAVDLTGWWLDGGINFRFAAGTVIPARESAFLSPDPRAFRARKSDPRGGKKNFVIGPYSGALQPNEAISLYNASHQLIANLGGIAYDLTSQGKGDLDLKVAGVAPGSRIFVIFSANTRHRLGCGPLLGMGMDALGTLTLPPNTQPFHVRADNNGEYRFIARPGTLPRQLTIDSRALLFDFQAKKILTSRILRVTL
ncbi:MAG: lamin tail domain-containing protein, partial [Planctomycetota bacterium]|nr:lamin tail domain-containing protein [Planctomycetota bacterium]